MPHLAAASSAPSSTEVRRRRRQQQQNWNDIDVAAEAEEEFFYHEGRLQKRQSLYERISSPAPVTSGSNTPMGCPLLQGWRVFHLKITLLFDSIFYKSNDSKKSFNNVGEKMFWEKIDRESRPTARSTGPARRVVPRREERSATAEGPLTSAAEAATTAAAAAAASRPSSPSFSSSSPSSEPKVAAASLLERRAAQPLPLRRLLRKVYRPRLSPREREGE